MSTYRQMIYMCLDELKLFSDDSSFTEEHIKFLLDKYRAYILKQQYEKEKKQIPESNYQTLCLDLIDVPAMDGEPCEGPHYLRSKEKIPDMLPFGNPKVSTMDFYQGNITYVNRERMKYVGCNKYLKNIIYCSISPEHYLYFKSSNPQFLYLEKAKFSGIFESTEEAEKYSCESKEEGGSCDYMDNEYPLEEALIPQVIQSVVKELAGPSWKPMDDSNNAADDLATLATFLSRNSKSDLQKALSE